MNEDKINSIGGAMSGVYNHLAYGKLEVDMALALWSDWEQVEKWAKLGAAVEAMPRGVSLIHHTDISELCFAEWTTAEEGVKTLRLGKTPLEALTDKTNEI